ncbi:hypothetical protein ACGYLO_16565 [Sulfitobacter sp. 1A13353]|uniref:phage adaptor protein n=1 Tax=Sulfitobacter sp. 1A13353 TaxID=3368568 RepID=UPI0037455818
MALSTYAELQAAIASELFDRADADDVIPRFIRLAEVQMQRELRHYQMVKRATASIDSRYTELPVDHLQTIRFHLDGKSSPLEFVSPDAMADHRAAYQNATGEPRYMAFTGNTFEVFPTPNATYTGELQYYRTIPALSDANPTNWLLTDHPDAYLYGALLAAGAHFADADLTKRSTALYMGAVSSINEVSMRQQFPGPMRMQFKRGRQ